jgi:hypothetical protein
LGYLLYCITHEHEDLISTHVKGISGGHVFPISGEGLSAVVSEYNPKNGTNLSGLLAYRDVIDSFFTRHAVVPMRYGCFFPQESGVQSYLREHQNHFLKLLKDLDGHEEMGIRVLPRSSENLPRIPEKNFNFSDGCGRSFLASRKAHYAGQEQHDREKEFFTTQSKNAFTGLYKKWKAEYTPMLSLYFLVPHGDVLCFRKVFHELENSAPHRLFLSGPWPPYNFVSFEEMTESGT